MKVYDISQPLPNCAVYEGDISPIISQIKSISEDGYNLSNLTMCLHNGTHIDAPSHFNRFGETISAMPIDLFVGDANVFQFDNKITREDIISLPKGVTRLLIKGNGILSAEAALALDYTDIKLIACESQSIGGENFFMVHRLLSGRSIAILEGVCLKDVPVGKYFISALPLNILDGEASPTRAVLIDLTAF
ncbi:MAG: cyclase family protein [Clostridia bacterium]